MDRFGAKGKRRPTATLVGSANVRESGGKGCVSDVFVVRGGAAAWRHPGTDVCGVVALRDAVRRV